MPFKLFIDDNFHYGDESERVASGEFATLAEAVAKAVEIVDDYLYSAYTPGMTGDELMASYCMFGEDPFIIDTESQSSKVLFSAREYAAVESNKVAASGGLRHRH